mgnify:CR=1 FL=1
MKLYECWICTDLCPLQTERIHVKADNDLIALQKIIRLYQPVKVLGKAFVVRNISEPDISCRLN